MTDHESRVKKIEIPLNWSTVSTVIGAIATIATLYLTIYYQISSDVDRKIDAKVYNNDYIRKIASEVRPSIIFDEQGKILQDGGGLKYIEDIEIRDIGEHKRPKKEFILTAKAYLQSPPLLEPLDTSYKIEVSRGKKFEWIYKVEPVGLLFGNAEGMLIRFRLEIFK